MRKRYKVILIVLLLAVYCFAFQGNRGLFDPDEGRYSAVALQMIKSNDWLHPRTHPEHEHWAKPPLTYWAIAGSILVFGRNEFAVRFPNVLSFFVSIIACFYLGKIFVPKRPWIPPLIFATFLFPATVSTDATADFPVTMWETLAVCLFAYAYWGKDNKQSVFVWLMWACFGLAFLTKGPPGLLPLFSIIVFLQLRCSKERGFRMPWIRGFLIMLFIGGSWFFAVISQRPELAQYFLWDELVLRMFTAHHERHSQWYAFLYIYVPVLVFGTLPWTYYAGRGLMKAVQGLKNRVTADCGENNTKCLFLLLWFFIPLIIFVIAKSKLPLYVLPLFVPLAVISAGEIERINAPLNKMRYGIALWCVLMVLARVIGGTLNFKKDASKFAEKIKAQYPPLVEEIVFVNAKPALGLQFYTGSNVEYVPLKFSDLGDEFRRRESRLWVVRRCDEEAFRKAVALHHKRMQSIGPVEAREKYVLFREMSGKIDRPEISWQ